MIYKTQTHLVGISGKRGVGKTTLADYLVDTYNFKKVSFASKLREYTEILVPEIKNRLSGKLKEKAFFPNGDTPRDFMISLGALMRFYDQDYWLKTTGIDKMSGKIVIDDLRFPNELEFLKKLGAKFVRINRYPKLNVYGPDLDDPSETSLDDYKPWDYVVEDCQNVTLSDLYKQADIIMDEFEIGRR